MNFKVVLLVVHLFNEFEHIFARYGHDTSFFIELADDTEEKKTELKEVYREVDRQLFYRLNMEATAFIMATHTIRLFESQTLTTFSKYEKIDFHDENLANLHDEATEAHQDYRRSKKYSEASYIQVIEETDSKKC